MSAIARPICGSCSAPSQPVRAAGSRLDPRADRLDHEDVGEPGDHRLAAGPQLARLGGHQRAACSASSPLAGRRPPTWMTGGRISTRLRAAGWSKRTAPQISVRRRAAAAVAEDLVAVARPARARGRGCPAPARRARCAATWPAPCGTSARSPGCSQRACAVVDLEQAAAGGDDVEPQVAGHRRQRQAPRRGELRAAVEGAVHPQEVQRLAERVRPAARGRGVPCARVLHGRPRRRLDDRA